VETEKEKLIRAYRQGVKDAAQTALLLVGKHELTLDEIRDELESFRMDNAAAAVDEMFEETPRLRLN
jgi:hypothetical protein